MDLCWDYQSTAGFESRWQCLQCAQSAPHTRCPTIHGEFSRDEWPDSAITADVTSIYSDNARFRVQMKKVIHGNGNIPSRLQRTDGEGHQVARPVECKQVRRRMSRMQDADAGCWSPTKESNQRRIGSSRDFSTVYTSIEPKAIKADMCEYVELLLEHCDKQRHAGEPAAREMMSGESRGIGARVRNLSEITSLFNTTTFPKHLP